MWTIFAPTYATLSMGYFKSKFCRICIDGLGETLDQWCQFLDESEASLGKTKIDPNKLLKILNPINPSIKFTLETIDKELLFLDILIIRNDYKIWIYIYFKLTNTRR